LEQSAIEEKKRKKDEKKAKKEKKREVCLLFCYNKKCLSSYTNYDRKKELKLKLLNKVFCI
jgi:hypothetical protein